MQLQGAAALLVPGDDDVAALGGEHPRRRGVDPVEEDVLDAAGEQRDGRPPLAGRGDALGQPREGLAQRHRRQQRLQRAEPSRHLRGEPSDHGQGAQLLVERPGHGRGPQPALVGEQREDRLAEQPVRGSAADVALELRAHGLQQLVVLHAGRARRHAGHAAQAPVDVLVQRPLEPDLALLREVDQVDPPARGVHLLAPQLIGRAGREAEAAVHAVVEQLALRAGGGRRRRWAPVCGEVSACRRHEPGRRRLTGSFGQPRGEPARSEAAGGVELLLDGAEHGDGGRCRAPAPTRRARPGGCAAPTSRPRRARRHGPRRRRGSAGSATVATPVPSPAVTARGVELGEHTREPGGPHPDPQHGVVERPAGEPGVPGPRVAGRAARAPSSHAAPTEQLPQPRRPRRSARPPCPRPARSRLPVVDTHSSAAGSSGPPSTARGVLRGLLQRARQHQRAAAWGSGCSRSTTSAITRERARRSRARAW